MERVYIDATGIFSFYQYEIMYSGVLKILAKGRPVKLCEFTEKSDNPNIVVFEILEDWGLIDDDLGCDPCDYDPIGCEEFAAIDIMPNGEIVDVQMLDWETTDCTCECGEKVVHKASPIPPGYGVTNEN